jgi:hypothetical protein
MHITSTELPGAVFFGRAALAEFVGEALRYERACQAFTDGGSEIALCKELRALGFEWDEIAAHVASPGYRMQRGYACG